MNTNRKVAVFVGVFFLLGYVGVFAGGAIYGPVLDVPDYLAGIYPNRSQLILGMLIELVNDVAVIGIAVLLYPILKQFSESLAVGYLSFRLVEAVTLVVSKISVLSLIPLSQAYSTTASPAIYEALGESALAQRNWASNMQVVFFLISALILYVALYQTRLVPRFIAGWGVFAVLCLTLANVLSVPDPTQSFEPSMLLYFPIFLSEILLALWLIVKGFSPAPDAASEQRRKAFA